jgi:hypothetical protein
MKFFETHFEEYINNTNIHPKLNKIYERFPTELINLKNLIFYGPAGVGKYTQMLFAIKKYSPSELKYEKKISINFNKNTYYFKISDIHFEIDMALLGCQSKLLWNEIYHHILDIIYTNKSNIGIIVCKNFQEIHSELLEIFYSYMQTLFNTNIHIKFILISEEISFIPDNILNTCMIIPVERPSKNIYKNLCAGGGAGAGENSQSISDAKKCRVMNIKALKSGISYKQRHIWISNKILDFIINYKSLDFMNFRDILYDLFIYNINIFECIWYILTELIRMKKIKKGSLNAIFNKSYYFLLYYNNNYRPIYHLENYFMYLIDVVHFTHLHP